MNNKQYKYFAGFDWATNHHDMVIVDEHGKIVDSLHFDHTLEGWESFRKKVQSYPALGLMVETSFGIVVDQLLQSGVDVYPINPFRAKHYRKRYSANATKTDSRDAYSMANALRNDLHEFNLLKPRNERDEALLILCRDHNKLIERRTLLVNQLKQALREYFPTALEAFNDWTKPFTWRFILRFPTAEKLSKGGKRAWEKFLHSNKLARPTTYQKRLDIFATATQWKVGDALVHSKSLLAQTTARELQTLQDQIVIYENAISKITEKHEDYHIFFSLPGAGPTLAPRMLSNFGSDRERYKSTQEAQMHAGTAPTKKASGKSDRVIFRWNCDRSFRQTMHLFASCSLTKCKWAKVYYDAHRKKGKTHAHALRCLGQRWLKIIWKMWQTRTEYDGEFHAKNQIKHGSWVLEFNEN